MHLAQTVVNLFQTLSHLFEALGQTFFQGGLQLFVHRTAHFVQLVGIAFLQLLQLLIQRVADAFLHQRELLHLALLKQGQVLRQLLAPASRRFGNFGTQLTLNAFELFMHALQTLLQHQVSGFVAATGAAQQHHQQQGVEDANTDGDPDFHHAPTVLSGVIDLPWVR